MEQDLPEEVVLEQEEAREEVAAEAEWEAAKQVQVPGGCAYAPLVELLPLIKLDCRAIKSSVLNAALQW